MSLLSASFSASQKLTKQPPKPAMAVPAIVLTPPDSDSEPIPLVAPQGKPFKHADYPHLKELDYVKDISISLRVVGKYPYQNNLRRKESAEEQEDFLTSYDFLLDRMPKQPPPRPMTRSISMPALPEGMWFGGQCWAGSYSPPKPQRTYPNASDNQLASQSTMNLDQRESTLYSTHIATSSDHSRTPQRPRASHLEELEARGSSADLTRHTDQPRQAMDHPHETLLEELERRKAAMVESKGSGPAIEDGDDENLYPEQSLRRGFLSSFSDARDRYRGRSKSFGF